MFTPRYDLLSVFMATKALIFTKVVHSTKPSPVENV